MQLFCLACPRLRPSHRPCTCHDYGPRCFAEGARTPVAVDASQVVDATTFADWGADFVKLDSCGGTLNNGTEAWVDQYGKHARHALHVPPHTTSRAHGHRCAPTKRHPVAVAKVLATNSWHDRCHRVRVRVDGCRCRCCCYH